MPLISLCAIVRNDELLIRKMLDSVVGVVDEIVIADTGSTDGTVDRIEQFASEHPGIVKLLYYEWNDDFAAARNFTLEHASGDWVLVLDADEFLASCDSDGLRTLLSRTNHDGFLVKVRNYTGSMVEVRAEADIDSVRLFRRFYRYEGPIHEQIVGDIQRKGGTFSRAPLLIHHLGYLAEYRALKNKTARNTDILERQLRSLTTSQRHERWFAWSNLLQEYQNAERWDELAFEGRLLLEELLALPSNRRPPFTKRVFRQCIVGLRQSGRLDEAIRIAREATRVYPQYTDAWHWLGETFVAARRYVEAMQAFQRCRALGDVSFDTQEYIRGAGTYLAARNIANCWLWLGDDVSARDWFLTSLTEERNQPGILVWLVLLIPDQTVLYEIERLARLPQRYSDFLLPYACLGYDDAPRFIAQARNKWGDLEFVRRAAFAYEIGQGREPVLPENPTPGDFVRRGLRLYEEGSLDEAFDAWRSGGRHGQLLMSIVAETAEGASWSVASVFPDLMAARAIRFLGSLAPRATDIAEFFPLLMHTPLKVAFTSDAWLSGEGLHHYDWEERAIYWCRNGNLEHARQCLSRAYLPDGHLSVRGYLIQGDLNPDERSEQIRSALVRYPGSRLLAHVQHILGSSR